MGGCSVSAVCDLDEGAVEAGMVDVYAAAEL